jgi:hypothetical protein
MSIFKKLPRRQYLLFMGASAISLSFGSFRSRATAQARCRRARVTILSVSVSKSESYGSILGTGIGGEPGNSAEWDLVFTVAGQQYGQLFGDVRNGSVLQIDHPFVVDLNSIQETLAVSISGVEVDDTSANDPLPTALYQIVPKDNWTEGQTFSASAANEDFSYSFSFRIECADVGTQSSALSPSGSIVDGRQDAWRWCNKCQALAFAGGSSRGACPAGGVHDHQGSSNYVLTINAPNIQGQSNWRWCNKCQVLAFAGAGSLGRCAAGGEHNHRGSSDYILSANDPNYPGQSNWRWCNKCQTLAFAGGNSLGACPAGGVHNHEGSSNYTLQSR